MKKLILAMLLSALPAISAADDIKPQSVSSIHDGDTFTVDIAGCQPVFCRRIPVRINGIDTPEMRGKCQQEITLARAAKQFLVIRLRSGEPVELRNVARDKYFRILADVFVGGKSVGEEMVTGKLARYYDGGRKDSWCGA